MFIHHQLSQCLNASKWLFFMDTPTVQENALLLVILRCSGLTETKMGWLFTGVC